MLSNYMWVVIYDHRAVSRIHRPVATKQLALATAREAYQVLMATGQSRSLSLVL